MGRLIDAFLDALASTSATVADTLDSMARAGIAVECLSCRFFCDGTCMVGTEGREWPCIDEIGDRYGNSGEQRGSRSEADRDA